MVTNPEYNAFLEPGCISVTLEKKYFHVGNCFIKRTLRSHEQSSSADYVKSSITAAAQRLKNDAAIRQYLHENTSLPIPPLQSVYEDDGAVVHCTEYVEGIEMHELSKEDQEVVTTELLEYVAQLHSLRSEIPGIPGQDVMFPPYRVNKDLWKLASGWRPREGIKGDFRFCHNDLSQANIRVDPNTLKITAIDDWEYGGFWPVWFERSFWKRNGPGVALEGEEDDVDRCQDWLVKNCEEVALSPLLGIVERVGKEKSFSSEVRDKH